MTDKNKNKNNDNFEEHAGEFMSASDAMSGMNKLPEDEFISDSDEEVNPLEEELKAANDRYLRLAAEFDNFRKRNSKEKLDLIKTASEDIIHALLEVIDDSDRATKQFEESEDLPALKKGVILIFDKLKNILKSKGLEEIKSIGETFNTDFHEAITELPANSEEQVGKVMDQVSKGYKLNDKVIRHAKVVVGR